MSDIRSDNFNKFALQTRLFKGRFDLYFCYLKSEKLALALKKIFSSHELASRRVLEELLDRSERLPANIIQYATDQIPQNHMVGYVFEILTFLTFVSAEQMLSEENANLLRREYQGVARRLTLPGGYLTLADLSLPELPVPREYVPSREQKGHINSIQNIEDTKRHSDRADVILKIINDGKRVSIKDISKIVRDCSEKTIQRELIGLMRQGLVRKEGERRWSTYVPT